jgi:hypothetical protein
MRADAQPINRDFVVASADKAVSFVIIRERKWLRQLGVARPSPAVNERRLSRIAKGLRPAVQSTRSRG